MRVVFCEEFIIEPYAVEEEMDSGKCSLFCSSGCNISSRGSDDEKSQPIML
jgi:hypothetical protein